MKKRPLWLKIVLTVIVVLAFGWPWVVLVRDVRVDKLEKRKSTMLVAFVDSCMVDETPGGVRMVTEDSLMGAWIAAHDTTVRKFIKTQKVAERVCKWKKRKTGRMECEEKGNGKSICEPEYERYLSDECVTEYVIDTVWTEGWPSEDAWKRKAKEDLRDDKKWTLYRNCEERFNTRNPEKYEKYVSSSGSMSFFMIWVIMYTASFGVPFLLFHRIWRNKGKE